MSPDIAQYDPYILPIYCCIIKAESMAKTETKKSVFLLFLAVIFFAAGCLTAYFLIGGKSSDIQPYIDSIFKNPSGPPHIEGPTGPPPQSYGDINPSLTP